MYSIWSKSSYEFRQNSKVIAIPKRLLENALVIRNFGLLKTNDPQTLQLRKLSAFLRNSQMFHNFFRFCVVMLRNGGFL